MSVKRRPDGKWRARVRTASGKEVAKHFTRKSDAERWEAGARSAISRGDWIDPALARVTVGSWAEQWMAAQVQLKPTTRARHEVALRRQILPTWQDISLSAVSYAEGRGLGATAHRVGTGSGNCSLRAPSAVDDPRARGA